MLPMRPIALAHASIASLSVVFRDDAWPTMAQFRRSSAERVAITQIRFCSKHASNSPRAQAENLGSSRGRCGRTSHRSRGEIGSTGSLVLKGLIRLHTRLLPIVACIALKLQQ